MLTDDRAFARRLTDWYAHARRALPWRTPRSADAALPDPYHVLVSEAMLQQTQVATVIPYFERFIARFPTLRDLAESDEQDVLRLWQGLGYYSRARNLRRAAMAVVERHGGTVPRDVDALLALPGVGRYTAGAVASLAFDVPAPIVDGNVVRVLCRLDRIDEDPRQPAVARRIWERAEQCVAAAQSAGVRPSDFNSGMMELGATVCTPRTPQCLICPVREACAAAAAGVQHEIPRPKAAKVTPLVTRTTFCIRRPVDGRYLVEQRPPTGRWAGMWQFVTVDLAAGRCPPVKTTEPRPLGTVRHALTHRRYCFTVMTCDAAEPPADDDAIGPGRRWVSLAELDALPLPKPQLRIAAMLRDSAAASPS